jgi:chromosome segregation protein
MAQGQIDQILSAHPEDRRTIFEEAAGINKYKHQKKEALRKLEYTEANLVRITDIIKEVKRQIISLQRQAGKARRYKELFDQLKVLDTRLARHRYDLLHTEVSGLESQIVEYAAKSDQFAAQITEHETQVNDLRRSLGEIERAISDAVNHDHELKGESDRHQQRIGSHTERIVEFEQIIANHHREIAGSEERISIQDQDLARLNAEFDQIDSLLAAELTRLQTQQAAVKQIESELSQKTIGLDDAKSALIDWESRNARRRNELAALDHKKKHDVLRADKLSTENLQLEDQRRALQQRLESFNTSLTDLRSTVESLRATLASRGSELSVVTRQLVESGEQHHTSLTDVSQKRARLEVLRQLFAAPDGRSTLGQILEVEPKYGAAVEAALSHHLRTVLADNLDTARTLLHSGAQNPSVAAPELAVGRVPPHGEDGHAASGDAAYKKASDIPQVVEAAVPAAIPGQASETDATTTESVVGRVTTQGEDGDAASGDAAYKNASNVVRVRDSRFEPLIRSLLGNVVIADDLDAALALRATHPSLAVATLAGEFISDHGILSAVSTSYIAEINSLSEEAVTLEARTSDLAAAKAESEQKKARLDQEVTQLRADLHAREVTLAGKEGELNALATEQRDLETKIHTVIFELNAINQQNTEETRQRQEILEALSATEAGEAQLREQILAAHQAVSELTARREEATNELTELRVAVGGVQHKREAIQAQREPIAGRVRDLRERMQTCADEIASYSAKIEQFRQEIAESEQKRVELSAVREQAQQQLGGLHHQRSEVATGIDQAEAELKALRQQANDAQQQKSGFDIQVAQKRMEIQNLKDRVWQKYQVNVEDVHGDTITITLADQGPAVSEQVPLPADWEAIEAQAAELQSKLDAMGPVNVEAINEYDELEERYTFLSQQHDDLVKAKDQLLQVISKINSTTKQLFTETFDKVRENFQSMFTELFGGGKASLLLLDENDPLESGIEIVAKPPGKQLQSIMLLSGGEKTLTATALLFSIYMVKPSPFCVLDELDAPLDESNINRFVHILQRFITQSQFVIITHNKRTIGMADALYGITMEEHGVSKVVSVKFSPREETERKQREKVRDTQEERIDGSASAPTDGAVADKAAFGTLPHEEPLSNDLLRDKEQTVAPITDMAPIEAPEPTLGQPAPEALKAEVQAAVAAAVEVAESVQKSVEGASPTEPKL